MCYLSVRVYFLIMYVMKILIFIIFFLCFFSLGLNQLQAARGGKRGVNMNPCQCVKSVCVCARIGELLAVLVQVF